MLSIMFQNVAFSSNLYQHIIDVFAVFLSFSVVLSCCMAAPGLAVVVVVVVVVIGYYNVMAQRLTNFTA